MKKEDFGLDIDLEEISMIIEYGTEGKADIFPDSYEDTDRILSCFEGQAILPYGREETECTAGSGQP